ncbi:circadian clock protein KaiC [Geobacter pelophilus]|uniref:non-specific serine/threonine protein kinase n=1 Tax=Geoanaerobacter pelophilus TaxID=60036 RepID=A0AAW4L4Y4_9BACT|nr:circadian clock protein KaiC [Geoanaerobacter pelophilus]MBT0664043.1 circadian clock protein KaiC [Geoanaerobacter pelophilus]
MATKKKTEALMKCPTGIKGLDEITGGGLPQGRPTLICGGTGCGKTLLAMEFLIRGATEFGEPGVYMSFEEKSEELAKNFASLGFDLDDLAVRKKIAIDYVHIERSEIEETGEYDLEGLFIRLGHAIDSIGAKRVAIDTVEALFSGFANEVILRAELRRLFGFLKSKGVTAVITGEQGEKSLTRFGLEEYVADCVIFLSHKVDQQIATRRLRIVKYRGSAHGTNEYPFLIDEQGFSVMPISSIGLDHAASVERVSSGIARLDTMLGGKGYYRGSSVLVTGTAGTGKSSMAAHFVDAACRRGERCLYFAFEESRNQIIRNMRSIGINLEQWVNKGLLEFRNSRPTMYGLEMHLVTMHKAIESFKPAIVVVDPISNLVAAASDLEVKSMLSRLIDFLKMKGITAFCTDLTSVGGSLERTDVGISSLMDTWLLLQAIEGSGERNRGLYILKSRGMEHSNQVREFRLSDSGALLIDVYVGAGGVLTGAGRVAQEAKERAETLERDQDIEAKQRDIERKKAVIEAKIKALRTEFEAERDELERAIAREKIHQKALDEDTRSMARARMSDDLAPEKVSIAKAGKRGRR